MQLAAPGRADEIVIEDRAEKARAAAGRHQGQPRRYQAEQDASQRILGAEANQFRVMQKATAYVHDQSVLAQADATRFEKRLEQYQRFRAENPDYLSGIWWDEMGKLFGRMMKNGRIDLLDNHLGKDGLDITQFALPKKK